MQTVLAAAAESGFQGHSALQQAALRPLKLPVGAKEQRSTLSRAECIVNATCQDQAVQIEHINLKFACEVLCMHPAKGLSRTTDCAEQQSNISRCIACLCRWAYLLCDGPCSSSSSSSSSSRCLSGCGALHRHKGAVWRGSLNAMHQVCRQNLVPSLQATKPPVKPIADTS